MESTSDRSSSASRTTVWGPNWSRVTQAIGRPGASSSWIMIDRSTARAIQSAEPVPVTVPSAATVRPAVGSAVDDIHSSLGGVPGPLGSSA